MAKSKKQLMGHFSLQETCSITIADVRRDLLDKLEKRIRKLVSQPNDVDYEDLR